MHEFAVLPEAYESKLGVGCVPLRERDLTASGLGRTV